MGTDIHIYPEKKVNGVWQAVDALKLPNHWNERIIDEECANDDFDYDEQDAKHQAMTMEEVIETYGDGDSYISWEGPWDNDYDLRARNYDWFAILADVRNGIGFAGVKTGSGFNVIAAPRGFPDDMSPEVARWAKMVDHTPSWVTLRELLDFDWDGQTTIHTGVVTLDGFKEFLKNGSPSTWCGMASGNNVKYISNEEMSQIVMGCYGTLNPNDDHRTSVQWEETYRESVGAGFLQKVLDKLAEYGTPDEVRMVFYFDS